MLSFKLAKLRVNYCPHFDLEVVENGLLIKPILTSKRENWKDNIENVLLQNKDMEDTAIIDEFLNDNDLEDYQW